MPNNPPPPALTGLRVIEACRGVGGPFAAMLLAEQGADVIKVEPPSGDHLRGEPAFHVINRSKRAVVLDLESTPGRSALCRLLRHADLFLFDWPPGDAERLGLSVDALRALNPILIVGHLPAFGTRGPFADLPADEALAQAVAGICDAQHRYEPRPVLVNLPISGYAQGIVGAIAAAASLLARARAGRADAFELSAVAALFAFQTTAYMRGENVERRSGQGDPRGPIPTYRLVKASDGEWLFVGALTPPFWASMAVAAGLEDCLIDPRFAGAPLAIPEPENRRALADRVDAAFAMKPRDEWLRILEDADVPRAPVLTREEYTRDPQMLHNHMVVDVDDPVLGRTKQMGVPVRLQASPGRIAGPAPTLGQHNELLRIDTPAPAPAPAPAARENAASRSALDHPLQGVTVLDLGGFIAGANASMMLSDLGANVIKVESPGGDGWRGAGLAFFGSNRGKRGICIDLKKPEGCDLFLDLAERADVVLDNMRAGVMDRLGIGWAALRGRNPRLVHCSVTGYGSDGPYAHLPGFDPLMQARGGVMRAQGDPAGDPVFLQVPVCDYGTALSAALGVVVALVARERTGLGDRVETSLANSAFTMQAGEFIFYDGKPVDPPGGRDFAGPHALYRVHRTADGWIMLACATVHQAAHALRVLNLPLDATAQPAVDALAHPADGGLARAISAAFATRNTQDWLDALLPLGVPCAPCVTVAQTFDHPHMVDNGLWWDSEHPVWGHIRQTGAVVRWDAMSMHLPCRAPFLGEHSVECLREFGVEQSRIDRLVKSGVVVQKDPPQPK